jgi:hypothetical protein
MLTDLPWDVLYLIFTHHPTVYNVGVRLNWEFHDHLTELALTRISRWEILQGEIRRYVGNLWRNPPIRIYLMHPTRPMYEEFIGGRNQLPGGPFEPMERYQWTISMQNSRYSDTYHGYRDLVNKILGLIESGYYLDPCTYQQILSQRQSCLQLDLDYAEWRSCEYLNRLLQSITDTSNYHRVLVIDMCFAAIQHHGGAQLYPALVERVAELRTNMQI